MAEPTPRRPKLSEATKVCSTCGVKKLLVEFSKGQRRAKFGKRYDCKPCAAVKYKKWIAAKGDKSEYYHSCHVNQYGIPPEEYNSLLSTQNGVCAICGLPERKKMKTGKTYRLSIDHCHTTDKVRALLCCNCNAILGLAHDDVSLLSKCIDYIGEFQ